MDPNELMNNLCSGIPILYKCGVNDGLSTAIEGLEEAGLLTTEIEDCLKGLKIAVEDADDPLKVSAKLNGMSDEAYELLMQSTEGIEVEGVSIDDIQEMFFGMQKEYESI